MIRLIRTDGTEILLNVDLIQTVESAGDTVITLTGGEKIAVKNSVADVITKANAFHSGLADETRIYEGGVEEIRSGAEGKRKVPPESQSAPPSPTEKK